MNGFKFAICDLLILVVAYVASYVVRINFASPLCGWTSALVSAVWAVALQSVMLTVLGLNRHWRWRVVGADIPRYASAFLISASVLIAMRAVMTSSALSWARPPYSVTMIDMVFGFCAILAWRFLRERWVAGSFASSAGHAKREYDLGWLAGKTVMVTGAGGSIGSEIVRQVARAGAKKVLMVERTENSLYRIDLEMSGGVCVPLMIDINDADKLEAVFAEHRPEVVLHAAAYKHVPMCEWNPEEARRNNTEATGKVVSLASKYKVGTLVFISTDKAVNPKNVMGMSKREAEKLVLAAGYTCVRFGNVFGSSGSVVELWREQIAKGGPVTVTDRRMTRYFMSVEEAVSLVLTAARLDPGHIYTLDMGRPESILSLAERMIREAGYRPYDDIEIRFIGIRPGEKLEEELGLDGADAVRTGCEKIFRT